jgi:hypothetical protein
MVSWQFSHNADATSWRPIFYPYYTIHRNRILGFQFFDERTNASIVVTGIVLPYWALMLILLLVPLIWFRTRRRRALKGAPGFTVIQPDVIEEASDTRAV